jgi:hypothetical protein
MIWSCCLLSLRSLFSMPKDVQGKSFPASSDRAAHHSLRELAFLPAAPVTFAARPLPLSDVTRWTSRRFAADLSSAALRCASAGHRRSLRIPMQLGAMMPDPAGTVAVHHVAADCRPADNQHDSVRQWRCDWWGLRLRGCRMGSDGDDVDEVSGWWDADWGRWHCFRRIGSASAPRLESGLPGHAIQWDRCAVTWQTAT